MRRRDALKALTVPALTGLAGCGGDRDSVRVAVVWSGWELTRFRDVLREFTRRTAWEVSVQSVGDDIGALLGEGIGDAVAPDVALVPFPNLVRDNLDRLTPVRSRSGVAAWDRLLTFQDPGDGREKVYGVWFKVAHESMVWFRRDDPDAVALARSTNWADWLAGCKELAARNTPPLSIGAANGWTLTYWFENVLLGLDSQVYRDLARLHTDPRATADRRATAWQHPMVRETLNQLGDLWQTSGLFPGGPERARLTQFDQSVLDVFERGAATMVVGADFFWPIITQYTRYGDARRRDQIGWRLFPANGPQAALVGGDAAVLLRDGDGGRRLIEWLSTRDAATIWARHGGFLSLNDQVTGYPKGLNAGPLLQQVRQENGDGGDVPFDLSDRLGGRLEGGDGRGTWKIFTDFFTQVAVDRTSLERAVEEAMDELEKAARES